MAVDLVCRMKLSKDAAQKCEYRQKYPDAADEKLGERLVQALRVQGARDLRVKVQRFSSIPKPASGKAPRIKSGRLKKSEKHIEEGQDKG